VSYCPAGDPAPCVSTPLHWQHCSLAPSPSRCADGKHAPVHPVVTPVAGFGPHLCRQLGGAFPGRIRLPGGLPPLLVAPPLDVVQPPLQVVLQECHQLCFVRRWADTSMQVCTCTPGSRVYCAATRQCKNSIAESEQIQDANWLGVPPAQLRSCFLNSVAPMTLQHLSPVRQSLHHMLGQGYTTSLDFNTGSAGSPARMPLPAHAQPRSPSAPPAPRWLPPAPMPWRPAARPAGIQAAVT
jgi:hypothetical protein